ncbi:hypothetical protein [Autumnicola edwardsiae]|uniref:Uncharacterized protein n=1 Tax=Autumnicola edwardsiae TaxID=3075594 RepID=A0ABU3CTW6_9FLAO|nr:hypothetical protein [Zunongwangia sp. F297]MDT0649802.1 hypothetical protein [Zunongwangia sp. F297]
MADLQVEKKKSRWLWIILAALMLGIILLVFLFQEGNVDERDNDREEVEEISMAPKVLLRSSNVDLIQTMHTPFRINKEALV